MKRKRYQDHTVLFLAACLAYVIFSNVARPLGANRLELFPFFNWSLFTNFTSETRYDFAIYVEKVGQEPLREPTFINAMRHEFRELGNGIMLLKATRILAREILYGDARGVNKAKNTIERLYLKGPRDVEYTVRLIKYKPLERYRNSEVTPVAVLKSFEKQN